MKRTIVLSLAIITIFTSCEKEDLNPSTGSAQETDNSVSRYQNNPNVPNRTLWCDDMRPPFQIDDGCVCIPPAVNCLPTVVIVAEINRQQA